jgi:hypothetical protein
VSASARGTATDYSKGACASRADWRRARLALAGVALASALLLIVAELSPLYTVVVGSLQTPRRSVSAGSNHGYALALVATAALAMTVAWLRGVVVAGPLGATALAITLAVDLPDTRADGRLPESLAYSEARATAARGLALELAGGVGLVIAGAGLLVVGCVARRPPAPSSRR